jgi:hypothetical protein
MPVLSSQSSLLLVQTQIMVFQALVDLLKVELKVVISTSIPIKFELSRKHFPAIVYLSSRVWHLGNVDDACG